MSGWNNRGPGLAAAALLALGCAPVNQYATARTVPDDEVAATVAPEVWAYREDDPSSRSDDGRLGAYMGMPTVHVRYGLGDRADLGVHLYQLATGFDAKVTLIESHALDLALQTGARGIIGEMPFAAFGGPLILDLNGGRHFSLVLTSGVELLAGIGSGVLYTAGCGLDFRVSKKLAIHPEVTMARRFEDAEGTAILGGIGFTSGVLPSFDDDRGSSRP